MMVSAMVEKPKNLTQNARLFSGVGTRVSCDHGSFRGEPCFFWEL